MMGTRVVLALVVLVVSCEKKPPPSRLSKMGSNPWQEPIVRLDAPGLSMTNRLEIVAGLADLSKNQYLSADRIPVQRRALAEARGFKQKSFYHQEYAKDLLNSGRSEEALAAFGSMERYLEEANPAFLEEHRAWMLRKQAICFLRLGEQENCLANHHQHSCLFPVSGGGIHQHPRGSEGAIEKLNLWLELDPDARDAQWLLNIAYMTLGRYPDGVPSEFRISPETFDSDYALPRFEDKAKELGVGHVGLSGGSIMEDFDNDGLLDLMCSGIGLREPLKLFRNRGSFGFEDVSTSAGLDGLFGGLNLVQADYNNDGFVDVMVLRGAWFGSQGKHPNSLLKNNGDGTFSDVTEEAGLLSFHPTQTAVWFDFNSDGFLDVFIGNETFQIERHPCELFRNNGDGTFTECARENGLEHYGMVKGVAAGDFDNDGRPDLFLSQGAQENVLYRNEGPSEQGDPSEVSWNFADVSVKSGVTEPIWSFPTWFWDYDNDGWLDLFVADYRMSDSGDLLRDYLGESHEAETARLFRNRGDGTFEDVSNRAKVSRILFAMGCNYGDLDNDGYLDFYVGTGDPDLGSLMPNRMFRNDRGQQFQDVTTSGGFGHLQKGHGVSFGDIDNDGDQDIYQDMGGAYSGDVYSNVLYLNPGTDNQFIGLNLEGTRSNRMAVGARIMVEIVEDGKERQIHRTVGSGGSFGASPLRQHIGLGKAERVVRLEIRWPSGLVSDLQGPIEPNRNYRFREGDSELESVEVPQVRFQLGGLAPSTEHSDSM